MFSLIITIISIALVAALALATIYYGGTAFNKGSAAAVASQLINEGQQINGAVALYRADAAQGLDFATAFDTKVTANTVTIEDLSNATLLGQPRYLAQVPTSFAASGLLTANVATTSADVPLAVCEEVNRKAGVTGIPTAAVSGKVYSCHQADAGSNRVVSYTF